MSIAGFSSASINFGLNVAAVGSSLPLNIDSGLVTNNGITGVTGAVATTVTTAGSGKIGEVITQQNSTGTSVGSTQTDLVSITLTPGIWSISFLASMYLFESTGTYYALLFPTFGASNTLIFFDNGPGFAITRAAISGNGYVRSNFCMQTTVNISASTVYKLRYQDNSGTGTKNLWGEVRAIRIG